MSSRMLMSAAVVCLACGARAGAALAADVKPKNEFAGRATWKMPTPDDARAIALKWLESRDMDAAARGQAEAMWASAQADGDDRYLLDLLVATLAAGDERARELARRCSESRRQVVLPDASWLSDESVAPFERDNLRLVYGRWLVQESLYDEAAEQLKDIKPEDVVDPAALLFYQSVVHHRMLARDAGLASIARLLENESMLPKRYTSLARLMQADMEGLKDESLDHIARRMDDVRRRLDLGRAGPKVRAVEDGVIASLDKLIDDMEKQQQAAAAAAAKAGRQGGNRPSMPLPDSRPIEQKGPGDVAKKPIGDQSGWGDLPPRERQEALQQIGKDFPAHYRDMIEQYFRKLAGDGGQNPDK